MFTFCLIIIKIIKLIINNKMSPFYEYTLDKISNKF